MSTTYRAFVNTNAVRSRGMIGPGFVVEVSRDSRTALSERSTAFVGLLRVHVPCDGATARLERTDSRGYTTQIACYSGRGAVWDATSGATLGGRWTLEEWVDADAGSVDDGLPDFVDAGMPSRRLGLG